MAPNRISTRRGFTLIELLVVILILATLMAVALPLYLSSTKESEKRTCRANMQSISNAAHAWRVKNHAQDFSTLTVAMLKPDLGEEPMCPNLGTYAMVTTGTVQDDEGTVVTIPTGAFGVTCTDPEHFGFVPGSMSR